MDIEIWGFDHGVVAVLALPGSVMLLVGSLFLRFWYKVFVPSSGAHQDTKSVNGERTAGMFVGPSQFQRAKLVVVRQGEANTWTGGHCSRNALVCLLYKKL